MDGPRPASRENYVYEPKALGPPKVVPGTNRTSNGMFTPLSKNNCTILLPDVEERSTPSC